MYITFRAIFIQIAHISDAQEPDGISGFQIGPSGLAAAWFSLPIVSPSACWTHTPDTYLWLSRLDVGDVPEDKRLGN